MSRDLTYPEEYRAIVDDLPQGFGERLERALGDSTQAWLAKRVGVTRASVSNWVLGKSRPNFDLVLRIAVELDVSPGWLTGYDLGDPPRPPCRHEVSLRLVKAGYADLNRQHKTLLRSYRRLDSAHQQCLLTAATPPPPPPLPPPTPPSSPPPLEELLHSDAVERSYRAWSDRHSPPRKP